MKTNYSIKRIKELEAISLHLFWRKRHKKSLTKKEVRLQNKLFMCLVSQENKIPLTQN